MKRRTEATVALLLVALVSACGGDDDGTGNGTGASECQAGEWRDCICQTGAWGTQTCENGLYPPCVCQPPQAASGGSGGAGTAGTAAGGTGGTAGTGEAGSASTAPECAEGEQAACACPTGGIGVSVCVNGRLGPCTQCPGSEAGTGGTGGDDTGGDGGSSGLPDYVTVDPIAVCPTGLICQQVIMGTGPKLCAVPSPFGMMPSAPQCSTDADCDALGLTGVPCLAAPGYGLTCTQPCL